MQMKVVDHPYLKGIKCREDGAVFVPAAFGHAAHWTFGYRHPKGYRRVTIARKSHPVHRLICEAFHGICPEGCEADHINRERNDNRPENLRWVTRSENLCNRAVYAQCGVSTANDINAYSRTRYAADPEYRERVRERNRAWRAKKKAIGGSHVGS